ncbi:MAG: hypothetical protein ACRDOO_21465 [Actinomadura sp.]
MDIKNVLLIAFLVIVVIVLLQGAMVKKIGFGSLSVEFDHGDPGGRQRVHRVAVIFGVLTVVAASALVFFVGRSVLTWVTERAPALPAGIRSSPGDGTASAGSLKTVTGSWRQAKGRLTVTVARVDNADGTLRLHLKAANNSSETMFLPTGFLVATDNSGRTYKAAPFAGDWAGSVPSEGSISGVIELLQKVSPAAKQLSVSFTVTGGLSAPQGGITVHKIKIPH